MIEAVIFDVDGTLIDSVDFHAEAWRRAFAKFGREIKFYALRRQVGKGGDQLLPVFLSAREIREFGEAVEEERGKIFKRNYLKKIKPFPGVRELFAKLKTEEKKIVLASSAPEDELAKYKKIADIEDLVEEETSSDDAEKSKPEPDIFLAALKRLGKINKKNVIVIGDTVYDAEAAAKSNLNTVGVLTGGWTASELKSAGCREVYADIENLLLNYEKSVLNSK